MEYVILHQFNLFIFIFLQNEWSVFQSSVLYMLHLAYHKPSDLIPNVRMSVYNFSGNRLYWPCDQETRVYKISFIAVLCSTSKPLSNFAWISIERENMIFKYNITTKQIPFMCTSLVQRCIILIRTLKYLILRYFD